MEMLAIPKPTRCVDCERAQRELAEQRDRLRAMSSELALAEEGERRRIAAGLHDHVGQVLGVAKVKLGQALAAGPAADDGGGVGPVPGALDPSPVRWRDLEDLLTRTRHDEISSRRRGRESDPERRFCCSLRLAWTLLIPAARRAGVFSSGI